MINDMIRRFKYVEEKLRQEIDGEQNLSVIQTMDRQLVDCHQKILSTEAENDEQAFQQFSFLLDRMCDIEPTIKHATEMQSLRKLLRKYFATGAQTNVVSRETAEVVAGLQKRNVHVEGIIDQTANRISLIGTDYRFCYTSLANSRFYQRNRSDMLGLHAAEIIGEQRFFGRAEPFFEECFKGEVKDYYHRLDKANNVDTIMNCRMHPYYDPDGTLSGAVVTMRDVTAEVSATLDQFKLEPVRPYSKPELSKSAQL